MISKKLYVNIIIRVCLIVVLSFLLAYSVVDQASIRLALIFTGLILITVINLIHFLNRTNRNIRYFFDSVRNEDSSLSFPENYSNTYLRELHTSMNNVNKLIQKLRIETRQQEQYFKMILEQLATGIITYDKKGFILHVNSAAKRLLSVDVLTHLKQLERIDRNLYRGVCNLNPSERQLVAFNSKQGEIQLLLKLTSFGTGNDELRILSVQDIKHELDEKEVDSWMKLIRVLMHEIMNSIAPITSLSESLSNIYHNENKPVSPDRINEKTIATTIQGLNVIQEQGKGLMAFVESYRKLTRIPKPEMRKFLVSDLFSRVKILITSLDNEMNAAISFQIEKPEMDIIADENLISLVMLNLIKNAIEANTHNSDCRILIRAGLNLNGWPEICISDNGPGISEENIEEIFVPFFTTRENGSGIGLSISRQIMGAHGGRLTVRSKPGVETIFCMSFSN